MILPNFLKFIIRKSSAVYIDVRNSIRSRNEIFKKLHATRGWGNKETVTNKVIQLWGDTSGIERLRLNGHQQATQHGLAWTAGCYRHVYNWFLTN